MRQSAAEGGLALFFKVRHKGIHEDTHGLYLIVDYWRNQATHAAGEPPAFSNDFIFPNLRKTIVAVKTNEQGRRQKANGEWVDLASFAPAELPPFLAGTEWATEERQVNVKAVVMQVIKDYAKRWKAAEISEKPWPRDHTSHHKVPLTDSDVHGMLSSNVSDLDTGDSEADK